MSLYGMLFGKGVNSERLWDILNLDDDAYDVGRYRDISLVNGKIILLTRNGGGNREDHENSFESLRRHPNYVNDWDCYWDCTYAEIEFSIPEEHAVEVATMSEVMGHGEKFDALFQAMEAKK